MNHLSQLIMMIRQNLRLVLLAVVAMLVLLNVGQWLRGQYVDKMQEIDTRIELLNQYKNAVVNIEALRKQESALEKGQGRVDSLLFVSDSEERVTSAMQILLQGKVTESGMASESIRPVRSVGDKAKQKARGFQEVAIKARLTGTLNQFVHFVANLYRSEKLFKVESVALRPFKKKELKIFLELRGYYRIAEPEKKGKAAVRLAGKMNNKTAEFKK